MRRNYSIAAAALFLVGAVAFAAEPCPREIVTIRQEVAQLRDVKPPFAPPCRLINEKELRAELARKLKRDLPIPPELFLDSLWRLGLISERATEAYPALLSFYASQVLGFYEPEHDELVVVSDPPSGGAAAPLVWSHELAHAAQEHRFHLPSRLLAMSANGDAQRAASAIAEGEAMLVMFMLSVPDAGQALEAAEASVRAEASALPRPAGVPEYFVDDLVFPYTTGFATVLRVYRAGGWPAVDALLARPPGSTAVLLHPDRQPLPGPDLTDAALPRVPAGFKEVFTDTLGEWGVSFWLSRRFSGAQASSLAAAWDADRIRVVRSQSTPDRWALAWRLRCRSVEERRALQRALEKEAPHLLGHLTVGLPPELVWQGAGREVELRAGWPDPAPKP